MLFDWQDVAWFNALNITSMQPLKIRFKAPATPTAVSELPMKLPENENIVENDSNAATVSAATHPAKSYADSDDTPLVTRVKPISSGTAKPMIATFSNSKKNGVNNITPQITTQTQMYSMVPSKHPYFTQYIRYPFSIKINLDLRYKKTCKCRK